MFRSGKGIWVTFFTLADGRVMQNDVRVGREATTEGGGWAAQRVGFVVVSFRQRFVVSEESGVIGVTPSPRFSIN